MTKAAVLLMAIAFLYLDKPVAALQFDLDLGAGAVVTLESTVPKQIATATVGGSGKTRVIIYGLNADTFSGKFATVSGTARNISGAIGSGPDGKPVTVRVSPLNQPRNVRATRP